MTICIAAGCEDDEGKPCIVLCTDWRISTPIGGADTMLKQRTLPHKLVCLISGYEYDILGTLKLLRDKLGSVLTLDETNAVALVRVALIERKREKIEELVRGKYALGYDEFLKRGPQMLPADQHRRDMLEISGMTLEATFIVAGFLNKFPFLIETSPKCQVVIKEDMAVTGSGEFAARASLLQRQHMDVYPLTRTLYTVYEAKKYAERIAGVGEATSIDVLFQNGTRKQVSGDGLAFLADSYEATWS